MNTSINYAGFVDMFIDSEDDFEPYGVQPETEDDPSVSATTNLNSEFAISSLYET